MRNLKRIGSPLQSIIENPLGVGSSISVVPGIRHRQFNYCTSLKIGRKDMGKLKYQ